VSADSTTTKSSLVELQLAIISARLIVVDPANDSFVGH